MTDLNTKLQHCLKILESGNLIEAEAKLQVLLRQHPRDLPTINLLGIVLKRQGKFEQAITLFKQAIKLQPSNPAPWMNLGKTYIELRDGLKAVETFSKVVKLNHNDPEHHRFLACAYRLNGEFEKGLEQLQIALSEHPENIQLELEIIYILLTQKKYAAALQAAEILYKAYPTNFEVMFAHAVCFEKNGQYDQAFAAWKQVMVLDPDKPMPFVAVGKLWAKKNRERANMCFRHAVKLAPNNPEILAELCNSLNRSRYGSEAAHIQEAYTLAYQLVRIGKPILSIAETLFNIFVRTADYESLALLGKQDKLSRYWVNSLNVATLHLQLGRVITQQDRIQLLEFHREWGRKIEKIAAQHPLQLPPVRSKRDKIRVGLMSSDLRDHPVLYFVLPIIEQYDRSKFEFYCYSYNSLPVDKAQTYVASKVDKFLCLPNISDRDAAQTIANDQLDILFELGGATAMNKLEVMAFKPAPVQVSWLGYIHSSGLSTIDYLLGDPHILPEDKSLILEKPMIMPETWVTMHKSCFITPIIPQIPQDRKGYLTFGTMNNPYKYTPEAFKIWAEIMQRVPDSRFLFVRPEGGALAFRTNVTKEFGKYGINAERILFIPIRGKHLSYYNEIDIALDTFPHVGGTTTCETIGMGVPVITKVGPAFFERLSYSNLTNAGLGDLCVFSEQEYIDKTLALVEDIERRRYLRQHLRQQVLDSPLGQTTRFVRNFEKLIEGVIAPKRRMK